MVSSHDREILRALAQRVRDIAADPSMPARKLRLRQLNALKADRPVVLCFPEGGWGDLLPDCCRCEDKDLRGWEWGLRAKIYWWEHLRDDNTVEPYFDLQWRWGHSDFGVPIPYKHGENRGSYVWEPPLKDLDKDLGKLRQRVISIDREGSARDLALAGEIFGDILPPRHRGMFFWTLGLSWTAILLIGLENLMLFPYDQPAGLHRLMAFLRDDMLGLIQSLEREGVLNLMNESDYVGSGGVGYTDDLPQQDWRPGQPVRLKDIWALGESQETVGCSPAMFGEFILPYQVPLLEQFGLTCYGCCEAVHQRIDLILKHVPHLRRVSVAPWADQAVMAEKLAGKAVFSRKPNPSLVCVGFEEAAIREDIRSTLRVAGHLATELILKDTHTFEGDASRPARWVQIAYEEIDTYLAGKKR